MDLPQTIKATLLRRYKRFLADIELPDQPGKAITVHCPNPGAMTGLALPGAQVYLTKPQSKTAKLPYAWWITDLGGQEGMVGINANLPNKLVAEALKQRLLPGFEHYIFDRAEIVVRPGTRLDFQMLLAGEKVFMEVKNVHLVREPGLAEFPDCKTERGTKHLHVLMEMAQAGMKCVMLYCIQRGDCTELSFAKDIDPNYAEAAQKASKAGVRFVAVDCVVTTRAITIAREIPVIGLDR